MGQINSTYFRSTSAEEQYQKYRKLASEEARLRNECFSQSQDAYKKKQGKRAKELSLKGKEHARIMAQYNAKAVEIIFAANNGNRSYDEIDLHGLFVKEALEKTESRIEYCKKHNIDHLTVIVGRGNHSQDGIVKLKPAIAELMEKYQLSCTPDKPTIGCLYVEFGNTHQKTDLSFLSFFGIIEDRCVIC
ncbi:7111_t:CDS:2 [Acaulospora colombiana]|uniref:7111_t:CDS:1 n=1 Tax=Acaulospora colombiana TaxID=27376 RepID=A0ACA9LF67_9GLOM|nr:7111_t:CDS:2 [Acaulospora colombiana]